MAQQDLPVTLSGSPGPPDTQLIPQTIDVTPNVPPPSNSGPFMDLLDDLLIDWGDAPDGSIAVIYWPQLQATNVLSRDKKLDPPSAFSYFAGCAYLHSTHR